MKRVLLCTLLGGVLCLPEFGFSVAPDDTCTVQSAPARPMYVAADVTLKILLVEFADVKCKKYPGTDIPKFSKADYDVSISP